VFEGGGVKGTGLVGAVEITEQKGYVFENVAGASAGAIVASLIAAGYTAKEMKEIMLKIDYSKFKDEGLEDKIPLVGKPLSLFLEKGIYEGEYFLNWIRELLAAKGVHQFRDLIMPEYQDDLRYRYKLNVIASDITRGRLILLPEDIADYGKDPDELEVAWAVRMSMSIPYFYKPVVLEDREGNSHYIVDGGILSNYPVWIFDDGTINPAWPTFGYKLVEPDAGKPHTIRGPITLLAALFSTMMEAHDARYIKDANFIRTIPIETLGIQTTDFDMIHERKEALYESGKKAAEDFFSRWDFATYKAQLKEKEKTHRRHRIWRQS